MSSGVRSPRPLWRSQCEQITCPTPTYELQLLHKEHENSYNRTRRYAIGRCASLAAAVQCGCKPCSLLPLWLHLQSALRPRLGPLQLSQLPDRDSLAVPCIRALQNDQSNRGWQRNEVMTGQRLTLEGGIFEERLFRV